MKQKQITFIQTTNDGSGDRYIVDSLVNRVEPRVGAVFGPDEVRSYVQMRDTKVVIKGAKN